MSRQKRKQWNEDKAREVLARIERERTSIAQMARELGVTPHRIYWWRQRLQRAEPVQSQTRPAFVEVTTSEAVTAAPGFTVHVRGGRAVEVPPRFDAEELGRLISVLEVLPC